MTKVFLIDDSKIVRDAFKELFEKYDDIEVIGEAENPVDAFKVFETTGLPDLFILDIQMPKMDGLSFLELLYEQKRVPTLMCSTLLAKGSEEAIDALRLGAVGLIEKPKTNLKNFFDSYEDTLIKTVREASNMRVSHRPVITQDKLIDKASCDIQSPYINAIGSSTGGVQAIEEILLNIKTPHHPIVIVQHMPAGFTASLAERLNQIVSGSTIKEARDGDILYKNKIYIAPGDIHLQVKKCDKGYCIKLKDMPKVSSHKPSVDVFFSSVALIYGKRAKAFLLTGMGSDGAKGLLDIKNIKSATFVQDKASCVVWGMPKVAKEIGASDTELTLSEIADEINNNFLLKEV